MFSESMLNMLDESGITLDESTLDPRVAEVMNLEAAGEVEIDPTEYALQSMYEFRMNMMAADSVAVCEEYAYLKTNGTEMVNEAALDTIKAWFSRVKDAIIALGKRIAEFFKKVLHNIEVFVKSDVGFVKKYNDISGFRTATVELKKSIEATNFEKLELTEKYNDIYGAIAKEAAALADIKTSYTEEISYDASANQHESDTKIKKQKTVENIIKVMPIAIRPSVSKCETVEKFKSETAKLIKLCKTDYDKVAVSSILDKLKKTQADRKAIQKCFDQNKKSINMSLNTVKRLEAQSEKDTKKFDLAKANVGAVQAALTMLQTINTYTVQAFNARRNLYKTLIKRAHADWKRGEGNGFRDDEYASLKESSVFSIY